MDKGLEIGSDAFLRELAHSIANHCPCRVHPKKQHPSGVSFCRSVVPWKFVTSGGGLKVKNPSTGALKLRASRGSCKRLPAFFRRVRGSGTSRPYAGPHDPETTVPSSSPSLGKVKLQLLPVQSLGCRIFQEVSVSCRNYQKIERTF